MRYLLLALFLFGCAVPTTSVSMKTDKEKPRYEQPKVLKIYEAGSIIPIYEIRGNKIYKAGSIVPVGELK